MKPVFEERLAKCELRFALAGMSALPAVETNNANDLIDIVHNALNDDRRVWISYFIKEQRQRRLALRLSLNGRRCALGSHDVTRQSE